MCIQDSGVVSFVISVYFIVVNCVFVKLNSAGLHMSVFVLAYIDKCLGNLHIVSTLGWHGDAVLECWTHNYIAMSLTRSRSTAYAVHTCGAEIK